ncbi:unnamed protein product [Brassica rapa]|uniref:Uncharacterized protein n=1 Tax=Brassica campestris TaxID=3711 RepID=A0A8D9CU85_BRACM|nr:unnamed protein product [Brassica rapa]
MIHQPGLRACLLRNQGYRVCSYAFVLLLTCISILYGYSYPYCLNRSCSSKVVTPDAFYVYINNIKQLYRTDYLSTCPHDHMPISKMLLRLVVFTVLFVVVLVKYMIQSVPGPPRMSTMTKKKESKTVNFMSCPFLSVLTGQKKEGPVRQPCDHPGEVKPNRIAILYSAETPRRIVTVNHTQIARP